MVNNRIKSISSLKKIQDAFVLLRTDYNISFDKKIVLNEESDYRITISIPSIQYLQKQKAKTVIVTHLARPNGFDAKYSIRPIAQYLAKKIKYHFTQVSLVDLPHEKNPFIKKYRDELGKTVFLLTKKKYNKKTLRLQDVEAGDILLLENIRFWKEEEENNLYFSQALSFFADYYVNDAFSCTHRKHASVYGITQYLPSYFGLHLEKELQFLSHFLNKSKKPSIAIIGGAKISSKVIVIDKLLKKTDFILLGSALAGTFLFALGLETGKTFVDKEYLNQVKKWMLNKNITLPLDLVVAKLNSIEQKNYHSIRITDIDGVEKDDFILDVGPKTLVLYFSLLKNAKTVFWNGPLGLFEKKPFRTGSYELAKILANSKAKVLIGGGETVTLIRSLKLFDKYTFVSSGGGAMLEYIEKNGKLPGLELFKE